MQQKQSNEAIDAMAPETREIEAGGKRYTVRRLETRQIWPTLRAGLPIIEGLVALADPGAAAPSGGGNRKADGQPPGELSPIARLVGPEIAQFLEIMAEHGEKVTEIVAIGLDEKTSTIGKFEPQETLLAIKALIEVNRDFFTTRVAPILAAQGLLPEKTAIAGAVGDAMRIIGAGATPSSS